MDKPILLNIILQNGLRIDGARLQFEAPTISGFLAIEDPEVKTATTYIALSNIATFSVLNEEICNILSSFPIPKVKTKVDNTL